MEIADALDLFEFKSLEDVSSTTLKMAFKRSVVDCHPDKGGDAERFDQLLTAYALLSQVVRRLSGGRSQMAVIDVKEVQEEREKQWIHELNGLVNEAFDSIGTEDRDRFREQFNAEFEKRREEEKTFAQDPEQLRGYAEWLSQDEETLISLDKDMIMKGGPICRDKDLNVMFEYVARCGKKEPVTTLMLHPDEMAMPCGSYGKTLLAKGDTPFSSSPEDCPQYSDLQEAFTSQNTVIDKLPFYKEEEYHRTFEQMLAERELVYQTEHDRDLEAIAEYERRKQKEDAEHKQKLAEYYKNTASCYWALKGTADTIQALDDEKEKEQVEE